MIPVYVLTNNNHIHLIRGFAYLWNKYSDPSHRITVVGYDAPSFELPRNFRFFSLGQQRPKEEWSDSLLDFLDKMGHRYFILMLEDYWLNAFVDRLVINKLERYMMNDILRIDLSGNRLSYPHKVLDQKALNVSLIESLPGAKYQMSYQAAIWNKENLRSVLRRGENPWQSEINGSKRVAELRVLGTNAKVMSYQPVWRSQQNRWQLDKIKPDDLEYMKGQGWL